MPVGKDKRIEIDPLEEPVTVFPDKIPNIDCLLLLSMIQRLPGSQPIYCGLQLLSGGVFDTARCRGLFAFISCGCGAPRYGAPA